MRLVILQKAKYVKRWKDKYGKWRYDYGTSSPKKEKKLELETPKSKTRVPASTVRKMRKEIQNLLKPTYFKEIPISDISNALKKYGYRLSDEAGKEWSGFLIGSDSDALFKLSDMNGNIQKNTGLHLSWYKTKRGGKEVYEVSGYIT